MRTSPIFQTEFPTFRTQLHYYLVLSLDPTIHCWCHMPPTWLVVLFDGDNMIVPATLILSEPSDRGFRTKLTMTSRWACWDECTCFIYALPFDRWKLLSPMEIPKPYQKDSSPTRSHFEQQHQACQTRCSRKSLWAGQDSRSSTRLAASHDVAALNQG